MPRPAALHHLGRTRLRLLLPALAAGLLVAAAPADARDKWNTKVLAQVPSPGFPAKPYVDDKGRVWEGTYVNPNGDAQPSRVFEFNPDNGDVLTNFTVQGQDLAAEHGVQVATRDAKGRLILLDRTPGRALLLDVDTGRQTTYATFPDVNPSDSAKPFADYAAWGPDGSLYVTDYVQGVIFRVPPHGGTATVWLKDDRLKGDPFGTAGIVYLADSHEFLITQASGLGGAPGNPTAGHLYRVKLGDDGSPRDLTSVWTSAPGDLPDGFAVSKAGNVYIALVGLPAQLVELDSGYKEVARFPSAPGTGDNGSGVPFDSPSGIAFRGTSLIVANQSAIAGTAANQVLLDVEAAEPGLPEFVPDTAGPVDVRGTTFLIRTGKVTKRGLTLSKGIPGAPARVRVTRLGRTVATGTLRGRTLTLRRRAGRALSGRVYVRPLSTRGRLVPTPVQIG